MVVVIATAMLVGDTLACCILGMALAEIRQTVKICSRGGDIWGSKEHDKTAEL